MSYLTPADLKTWLGITETADDTLLATCITAAVAFIESDAGTGRVYEAAVDATHYFDPTVDVCGRVLTLDDDLASITSVTNGDGTTISASNYVLESAGGNRNLAPYRRIRLKGTSAVAWTWSDTPENSITVVGKWAASTAAPARIVQLVREVAAYFYRGRASATDGASDRPLLTGDGVTVLARRMPADLMARIRAERWLT